MIIIKNKIIPFKGFKAVTIWPFIFIRSELNHVDLNHEYIHGRQQLELFIILFYIIYGIEAIFKKYRDISFEKEAYRYEGDLSYLRHRSWWAQWKKATFS